MSDASSIRKTTTPLAPTLVTGSTTQYNVGPNPGALPGTNTSIVGPGYDVDDIRQQAASSTAFYESAIRFQLNPVGYTYSYTDTNGVSKTRATGQAYINSGQQWVPVGNVVISTPFPVAADAVTQTIFIADRPYNVVLVQEVHSATAAAGTTCGLYSTPAQPFITVIDPTGAGSGAIVIPVITGNALASITVVQGGANYGTGTYAVITGAATTAAVIGAVTLSTGAVSSIAVTSGGAGYTATTAISSSSTAVLASSFKLDAAVNVVQTGPLNLTLANTQLGTGARLGLVFNQAATGIDGTVTVVLQPS